MSCILLLNSVSGVSVPQWPKRRFCWHIPVDLSVWIQSFHLLMPRNLRQSLVIWQVSRAAGNVWPGAVARAQKGQTQHALGHVGLQERMPQWSTVSLGHRFWFVEPSWTKVENHNFVVLNHTEACCSLASPRVNFNSIQSYKVRAPNHILAGHWSLPRRCLRKFCGPTTSLLLFDPSQVACAFLDVPGTFNRGTQHTWSHQKLFYPSWSSTATAIAGSSYGHNVS